MRSKMALVIALLLSSATMLVAQNKFAWKQASSGGYTYKYVASDPTNSRFYTLKNGLTVILSVNRKEPRIAAQIAVRTGSTNDPATHTGLAHYLEHLLFKGTDKFGTLDWEKEKPYLDKIDALYEQYNSTTDPDKRKQIYQEIDKVSGEASRFSIANEYDKLMASIGSQGTNAHTWVEETVYEEDIPSNAVEKFLTIQAERFRNPIFRIFHTELEAVYEEKNISLDSDGRKIQEAMFRKLFPTHNYGLQSTIGTVEHLKNPSLIAIRDYYKKYYVPNNIAIVMSGDFNPDKVIRMIDEKFAYMKPSPVSQYKGPKQDQINGPVVEEVYGPSAESLRIVFRLGANNSEDQVLASVASSVLSNGKAGLFDLNLNKQQRLQGAGAGIQQYRDYGMFILTASPKQGQTLEEAKDLLLEQLEVLKKGDFEESLLKAIIANFKLYELQSLESNGVRVGRLVDGYIKHEGKEWNKDVSTLDEMAKITKKDLVAFANRFFGDKNYVVIYKRKGEDKNIVKVEKPSITPVETNAGKQSEYFAKITAGELPPISPVWLDYKKDLKRAMAGNAEVLYVQNKDNSIFNLYYYFDMGTWNNKLLSLALQYLQYIGTDKYSAEDITKQFYNIACSFSASAGSETTTISVTGLQENFGKAVTLLEDLIRNCKADTAALSGLKNRLMKARANNKLNKNAISAALRSYALYGPENPYNYTMTDEEIEAVKAEDLVKIIHSLLEYKHRILYYGPQEITAFSQSIAKLHKLPASWTAIPEAVKFDRRTQDGNEVLFAEYDAVQADIFWSRSLDKYDPSNDAVVNLFNGYFGGGMGSIVFQTIRESKALAYSTYAFVGTPSKKDDNYTTTAYVGTQADKLNEAIHGMNELLTDLPKNETAFISARRSLFKDLETERITKDGIIFSYLNAEKKGLQDDIRRQNYEKYKKLTLDDLYKYHQTQLSKKPYTYSVVGSEKNINLEDLKKYGELKKLSLTDLFGY